MLTQGKWSWHDNGGKEALSLRLLSGEPIIIPALVCRGLSASQLASVEKAKKLTTLANIVPNPADAQLIAASPELLAACKYIVGQDKIGSFCYKSWKNAVYNAQQAIAKAEN